MQNLLLWSNTLGERIHHVTTPEGQKKNTMTSSNPKLTSKQQELKVKTKTWVWASFWQVCDVNRRELKHCLVDWNTERVWSACEVHRIVENETFKVPLRRVAAGTRNMSEQNSINRKTSTQFLFTFCPDEFVYNQPTEQKTRYGAPGDVDSTWPASNTWRRSATECQLRRFSHWRGNAEVEFDEICFGGWNRNSFPIVIWTSNQMLHQIRGSEWKQPQKVTRAKWVNVRTEAKSDSTRRDRKCCCKMAAKDRAGQTLAAVEHQGWTTARPEA